MFLVYVVKLNIFCCQDRKWEKNLQQVFGETNVDKLMAEAKLELDKYFASLPKPSTSYSQISLKVYGDTCTSKANYLNQIYFSSLLFEGYS